MHRPLHHRTPAHRSPRQFESAASVGSARQDPRAAAEHDDEAAFVAGHAESPHVIAGIVPLPPRVPRAAAQLLERALFMRFEFADALDDWLNKEHDRLHGSSPFERLVEGDVLAVLRALSTVPLLADSSSSRLLPEGDDAPPLRLVG